MPNTEIISIHNCRPQAQLIDDLLDVSRIITGKLRLDIRPVDPTSIIDAAIDAVSPAAEAKGVRIQKGSRTVPCLWGLRPPFGIIPTAPCETNYPLWQSNLILAFSLITPNKAKEPPRKEALSAGDYSSLQISLSIATLPERARLPISIQLMPSGARQDCWTQQTAILEISSEA